MKGRKPVLREVGVLMRTMSTIVSWKITTSSSKPKEKGEGARSSSDWQKS